MDEAVKNKAVKDEAVKGDAVKRLRITMLVLLATAATAAQAQLRDPTRPPPSLMSASAAAAAGMPGGAPAAPQLQSILIAPKAGGRHVVVIDGHTLRLGDTYKGALLASVNATQVVLQSGTRRQVLKLAADPAPR